LEIAFENRKLRRLCEDEKAADEALGEGCARHLRHRLADLMAAKSVASLCAGFPRAITFEEPEAMALELGDWGVLAFVSNHATPPTKKDGRLDWGRVTRIRIVSIGGGK
jgi:proteic killer suppression protein